jgi:shikimate kinase
MDTATKKRAANVRHLIGDQTIALVGLMGAGKSAIGKKLALALKLPFVDADTEIEAAAKMPVAEIFEAYGEPEFRRLEASVIKRILESGPQVLATGGGAFMSEATRDIIHENGISLWLSADIDLLMVRVSKKTTRPLLKNPNPRAVMLDLMEKRYPIYAKANIEVASEDLTKDEMARNVINALDDHLSQHTRKDQPA